MRKAAESAAKWLISKVTADPKLNPLPYPFFKAIVNKQVEWARTQRGVILDFASLAEGVKHEILKAGIHVMTERGKHEGESNLPLEKNETETRFICNGCREMGDVDKKNCPLYNIAVCKQSGRMCTYMFMCAFYHDARKSQTPAENF